MADPNDGIDVGKEYDYLGQPVKVVEIICGPPLAEVRVETRQGRFVVIDPDELGKW